jgi:hypothetical protein
LPDEQPQFTVTPFEKPTELVFMDEKVLAIHKIPAKRKKG